MNMLPATPTFSGFDTSAQFGYYTYPMYPQSVPPQAPQFCTPQMEFTPKSDTTSDESINEGKLDQHKLSPRYREKRQKNNEAAKRSRMCRKQREKDAQKENEMLKQTNQMLQDEIVELKNKIRQMEEAASKYSNNSYYMGDSSMNQMAFNDSTNLSMPTDHMQQMHLASL